MTEPAHDIATPGPMLISANQIGGHRAGVALRTWHARCAPSDLAFKGITTPRYAIEHRNTARPRQMPVRSISFHETGIELVVAVFRDASALLLFREDDGYAGQGGDDQLTVIPLVFRIPSVLNDGLGEKIHIRVAAPQSSRRVNIQLSTAHCSGSWVDLEAGPRFGSDEVPADTRRVLLSRLQQDAAEMHRSHQAHIAPLAAPTGAPRQGEAPLSRLVRLKPGDPDPVVAYRHPAALPYKAYTDAEEQAYRQFMKDAGQWMLMRLGIPQASASISLASRRLMQDGNLSGPDITVTIRLDPSVQRSKSRDVQERLASIFRTLARGDEPPIPWSRLVHQKVASNHVTTLSAEIICQVFVDPEKSRLSNHEKLLLRKRFDSYWDDIIPA